MKYLGVFFFISLSLQGFSQSAKQYFGQAIVDIHDNRIVASMQEEIRKNPKVKVVRIDALSGQIFLITNELSSWSESEFISIFEQNSLKLNCTYVGVYGKDQIKKYPFTDCE